jgi:hypothetical protein
VRAYDRFDLRELVAEEERSGEMARQHEARRYSHGHADASWKPFGIVGSHH